MSTMFQRAAIALAGLSGLTLAQAASADGFSVRVLGTAAAIEDCAYGDVRDGMFGEIDRAAEATGTPAGKFESGAGFSAGYDIGREGIDAVLLCPVGPDDSFQIVLIVRSGAGVSDAEREAAADSIVAFADEMARAD